MATGVPSYGGAGGGGFGGMPELGNLAQSFQPLLSNPNFQNFTGMAGGGGTTNSNPYSVATNPLAPVPMSQFGPYNMPSSMSIYQSGSQYDPMAAWNLMMSNQAGFKSPLGNTWQGDPWSFTRIQPGGMQPPGSGGGIGRMLGGKGYVAPYGGGATTNGAGPGTGGGSVPLGF